MFVESWKSHLFSRPNSYKKLEWIFFIPWHWPKYLLLWITFLCVYTLYSWHWYFSGFCNCRSTCRLELTQRETNTDPLGENKDILLPKKDRCQSRSHLENECSREKASANDQRPSIHEENIVFIEERKILVIPKSKTSITWSTEMLKRSQWNFDENIFNA